MLIVKWKLNLLQTAALLIQEQLQEKFARFPQLLQEQFLTRTKLFDELRKHRNILQLKAASLVGRLQVEIINIRQRLSYLLR